MRKIVTIKFQRILTALLLIILFIGMASAGFIPVRAQSPTPTYDPLEEPPLPENPTELELGRNLYWHWCMPCHGDIGQGLTDEFRAVWESDHQNCWDRGCHAGHPGDMGFKIPTVVPAIVRSSQLDEFSSLQSLTDYLNSTHPPQHPGILEEKEYRAIASFVFTMNQRTLEDIQPTETPTAVPSPTLASTPTSSLLPSNETDSPLGLWPAIGLAVILTALLLIRQTREQS